MITHQKKGKGQFVVIVNRLRFSNGIGTYYHQTAHSHPNRDQRDRHAARERANLAVHDSVFTYDK